MAPPADRLSLAPSSNSPDHNAKGTQSGDIASEDTTLPPTACRHVVSGSLSLPALGCFSPVPHGTRPLSVTRESLALEGGPPSFTPGSRTGRYSGTPPPEMPLPSSTGLTPSLAPRSKGLRLASFQDPVGPTTPVPQGARFRLYPFRSPLLRASQLISLPRGTEMFQFPSVRSRSKTVTGLASRRAAPFGHLRDHCVCASSPGLSQLTTAFIALVCPGIPSHAFTRLTTTICDQAERLQSLSY